MLFPNLRQGGFVVERKGMGPGETKGVAFSRYYNDLASRGVDFRSGGSWTMQRAIVEGYDRVMWVFKSVNTIAADSAGLPYRLKEGNDEVDDHPMYRVLNKRANPLESGQVFRKRLSAQVLLSSRGAFVQKVVSNGGTVKELHILPPDRVEIIPGINGEIDHYRHTLQHGGYDNLDPDKVLWFRDPHPDDPYRGVTPLESAKWSVELDHMARLYNVSFMQNDGRPGGVLAVRDTNGGSGAVSEPQMNRIEERFGRGPTEAGKLSVIAGELSYVDLATRPRDMQYGQTSTNAKSELLAAFGMSEVVLGSAAGRTFDNADAELYNYWTRTIPAHNRILLDGFDEDSSDNLVGYFDTTDIEVLERAARKIREEARTEVAAGLRSIKSYADLAGHGDEIEDTVFTRSLYIPNGKTPLPSRQGDAAALGLDTGEPAAPEGGASIGVDTAALGSPEGAEGEPAALAAPAPASADIETDEAGDVGTVPGIDMAALGMKALSAIEAGGARPKVRLAYSVSVKDAGWAEDEDGATAQAQLEAELTAALSALADGWVERAVARTQSPKQRKGTRHWQREYLDDTRLGVKALDAAKAVDEQTWQEEAEEQTSPILTAAAIAAAVVLLTGMDVTPPTGETLRDVAARAVRATVREVAQLIGRSAARQARLMVDRIAEADQTGQSIEMVVDEIRKQRDRIRTWAGGVSVQTSTATINGSRNAAAEAATDDEIALEVKREWVTKRDDDVRTEHRLAHGQSRDLREPFIVGESLLRFPGDPLAPIHLTANCRCRLRYRHRRTGAFASEPDSAFRFSRMGVAQ